MQRNGKTGAEQPSCVRFPGRVIAGQPVPVLASVGEVFVQNVLERGWRVSLTL